MSRKTKGAAPEGAAPFKPESRIDQPVNAGATASPLGEPAAAPFPFEPEPLPEPAPLPLPDPDPTTVVVVVDSGTVVVVVEDGAAVPSETCIESTRMSGLFGELSIAPSLV